MCSLICCRNRKQPAATLRAMPTHNAKTALAVLPTDTCTTMSSAIAERPRHRAAGCVSFGQKWKTGTGRRYFADIIFNHCDIIDLQSYRIRWKKHKIKATTPLKIIQGHRGRYQSKARMRLHNSNWHPISYRFGIIAAYCSKAGHCGFKPPSPWKA